MNFYDFSSYYERVGRRHSWQEFYRHIESEALREMPTSPGERQHGYIIVYNQCESERDWYKRGQPYYKIYPALIPTFASTKMDVPAKYFRCPFSTILLRFPTNHGFDFLTVDEDHEVRTILLTEADPSKDPIMYMDPSKDRVRISHYMTLWIDVNEIDPHNNDIIRTYQHIEFKTGETIESGLTRFMQPAMMKMDWGIPISKELIICCMRISVAVCFLATGADKIVEPDVLNRHRERFDRANPEERNILHAKAKQRGKHGWTIGRFEQETLIPRRSSLGDGDGIGHELEFQHQRGAHFHIVRYGPAKSLSKVEFYRQITVRPDLDPSPITKKGYRTRS